MFLNNDNFSIDLTSVILLSEKMRTPLVKRDFNVLLYTYVGSAKISSSHAEISMSEGDVALIPAGYEFGINTEAGTDLIAVHFLSDKPLLDDFKKLEGANFKEISADLQNLISIWRSRECSYKLRSSSAVYKILAEINEKDNAEDSKIFEAEKYIRENFTNADLNVDDLSARCDMSDTYFRRLFTERYGMTPIKYINKLRLDLAKELLESKYYSVGEVASTCGFSNINYFSTFIKKELGISPKKL